MNDNSMTEDFSRMKADIENILEISNWKWSRHYFLLLDLWVVNMEVDDERGN